MSGKASKAQAEKFQHQLLELLKDEPNRKCADCHARGPRWASWNLGVFICIRCAGMHRNLGVHIAKVKSVNLDTWTQEQVDNMLAWGNGVGNEFYEYKLPSDFRRPKDDKDVEIFIRNKYDKKLYVHDNFDYAKSIKNHPTNSSPVPAAVNAPTASVPVVPLKKPESYAPPKIPARKPIPQSAGAPPPSLLQVSLGSKAAAPAPVVKPAAHKPAAPTPKPAAPVVNNDLFDLFGDMVSAAPPTTAAAPAATNVTSDSADNLLKEDKNF